MSGTHAGGRIDRRLAELGIVLPEPAKPVAAYVPTRLVGGLLYVSGQIPLSGGVALATGIVGEAVTLEQAKVCARQCVLNGLAAARAALADRGGLDAVASVVKVGCFVAAGPTFTAHPQVANGASELLVEVFGEAGRHARAAVGCPSLPLGVPVEVEFVFEVR
ncbi:MAG: RidA family protein [Planctomycetaceae bacterium]|jgi:enamine deaminase RidA (YjgF/YER057c/UK114 family)|nr:RidA family protein [Planctomycetaceae bacterium]